jgi:choline monooxygenase
MTRNLPDFTERTLASQPLERASTIPSSWCVSPAFHDFDRERIFAQTWQYVGHVSQLPNAGDHIVSSIADNPILVLRDREGVLRAFYNVCRHRAGPLATQNGCGAKVLQCQYHGWTYALDGSLRGVPQWDRVDLFDKKDFGLAPVALAEWEGVLFVHLGENPEPIETVFNGIRERIAPTHKLANRRFYKRIVYPIRCNWKVYVDNYLEGYHVPIVHPELNKVLDYSQYITETSGQYSLQHSPFRADANTDMYGGGAGEAFYYFVFPNFMMNIVPGRLQTNFVKPISHDTCEVIFDYYFDDIETEAAIQRIEYDIEYSEAVQREDEEICEHVQRGLQSKAYSSGRYSVLREAGVHHFHDLLRKTYRCVGA